MSATCIAGHRHHALPIHWPASATVFYFPANFVGTTGSMTGSESGEACSELHCCFLSTRCCCTRWRFFPESCLSFSTRQSAGGNFLSGGIFQRNSSRFQLRLLALSLGFGKVQNVENPWKQQQRKQRDNKIKTPFTFPIAPGGFSTKCKTCGHWNISSGKRHNPSEQPFASHALTPIYFPKQFHRKTQCLIKLWKNALALNQIHKRILYLHLPGMQKEPKQERSVVAGVVIIVSISSCSPDSNASSSYDI